MNFKDLAIGVVLCTGLLGSPTAHADVILTYTGNDFNSFSPAGQTTYTTNDKVTAMITLANPLGDNLHLSPVTPLAFSLSDGFQTLSNKSGPFITETFEFTTDAAGKITMWSIEVENASASTIIETVNIVMLPVMNILDEGEIRTTTPITTGSRGGDPASWTITSAAVPEPPAVSVLGAGLLGLGLVWWRRRQKLDLAQ